jgi:hypothetical protein
MAGRSASVWPSVITSSFMSIVGLGHTTGRVASALTYAIFEVTVPELAVMAIAVVLVPSTLARPAAVILTSDGFAEVQVAVEVKVCVLPLL